MCVRGERRSSTKLPNYRFPFPRVTLSTQHSMTTQTKVYITTAKKVQNDLASTQSFAAVWRTPNATKTLTPQAKQPEACARARTRVAGANGKNCGFSRRPTNLEACPASCAKERRRASRSVWVCVWSELL